MSLADYINKKPIIETERLILRELVPSDVEALREWTTEKSIYKYWGKSAGKDDKNPELIFQKKSKPTKSFHWGIVKKGENKVFGEMWVYLIQNDRMAKVAYRSAPSYHNNGYMTEALKEVVKLCFENTSLKRLWTDVDVNNIASYKVLEKCGFLREGKIRQGKAVSTWCDYYIYGMLKEDYLELIK